MLLDMIFFRNLLGSVAIRYVEIPVKKTSLLVVLALVDGFFLCDCLFTFCHELSF